MLVVGHAQDREAMPFHFSKLRAFRSVCVAYFVGFGFMLCWVARIYVRRFGKKRVGASARFGGTWGLCAATGVE